MNMRLLTILLVVPLVLGGASVAAGQQTLQQVKDLYAQAAYEDALGVLSGLPGTEAAVEADRYRAFCLIALGRAEEAGKAIAEVVRAEPEYKPNPTEMSPRVIELFETTRRELLPEIARGLYARAKAAMEVKDSDAAIATFEALIRLVDDPDLKDETTFAELKLLATGFLELTRAMKVASAEAKAAAPPAPAIPPVDAVATPSITHAVPIRQDLPAWVPPDSMSQRTEYTGAVRVRIGEDGKVLSATITEPVHPAYEVILLNAARDWLYQPARQNGMPIISERTVQILLKPR